LQPLSDSQQETLEEAVATYEKAVTDDVRLYLEGRGLTEETVRTARLGVVADPHPGHAAFRYMVAIPYLDKDGLPLSIRFRCIEDHNHRDNYHGKYMSMTDEPSRMFNVRAVHEAKDEIHVAEGEFDALILTQLGLPAVAIPGASGFQGHHRRMLAGFSRVWVWGDPDEAGAEFTQRICRMLKSGKGVRLKDGDVTDTFVFDGPEKIYELVGKEWQG
jgi:DNA primase